MKFMLIKTIDHIKTSGQLSLMVFIFIPTVEIMLLVIHLCVSFITENVLNGFK